MDDGRANGVSKYVFVARSGEGIAYACAFEKDCAADTACLYIVCNIWDYRRVLGAAADILAATTTSTVFALKFGKILRKAGENG